MPRHSKRLSSSSSRFATAFAHINPVDGLNNGGDPQEPQQQPPQLDRAGEQPQPQDSPQHPLHPTPSPQHQHRTAQQQHDRIPSTTPGAEPPRDARDSGSARSHSTHLETSSSDQPKWSLPGASHGTKTKYPLRARDGCYACQVSRAQRTHSRP